MKKLVLLLLLAAGFAACSSSGKSGSGESRSQKIMNRIDQRDFRIRATRAIPAQGRVISLSGGYSLRVDGNIVHSHLPFFGRAFSVPRRGSEGITFSEPMQAYRAVTDERGRTTIIFDVRTNDDFYSYTLNIWPNGNATIRVQPRSRQAINFQGVIDLAR